MLWWLTHAMTNLCYIHLPTQKLICYGIWYHASFWWHRYSRKRSEKQHRRVQIHWLMLSWNTYKPHHANADDKAPTSPIIQWHVLLQLHTPISSKLDKKIKPLSICLVQSLLSSTDLFLNQLVAKGHIQSHDYQFKQHKIHHCIENSHFWHCVCCLQSQHNLFYHLRIGKWPP